MTRYFPKPHSKAFEYWNICPTCGGLVIFKANNNDSAYCAKCGDVEALKVPYGEVEETQKAIGADYRKSLNQRKESIHTALFFDDLTPEQTDELNTELQEIDNLLENI